MKKLFLALSIILGFCFASSAFAAAYAPQTTAQSSSAAASQVPAAQFRQTSNGNLNITSPCPLMDQNSPMMNMYPRYGCPPEYYQPINYQPRFGRDIAVGFGLMFVVTVVLVWAVLLLLIALLWHHLKKHKRS